ncbi:MAG: AI-2E family transporter [Haloarculaceae archaeon]
MVEWAPSRARIGWWALGALLAAAFAYVLSSFLGTFVVGVFLYYATRPLFRRINRRIKSRGVAAGVALVGLALPALALVGYALAIGLTALGNFLEGRNLASLQAVLGPYIDLSSVVRTPEQLLSSNGLHTLLNVLGPVLDYLGVLGTIGVNLFIALAVAYYLLRDDHRLAAWVRDRFADDRGVLVEFGRVVDGDLSNIFFGNILNALITATIGAIAYSVMDFFAPAGAGIPYAALIGLLAGVGSLVPIVGMKIVYVPVAGYLFARPLVFETGPPTWVPFAFLVVSIVVVDLVPDIFLRPYVTGRNLHVGMVMLSYVLGSVLFGWYGLLLGPLLLVVGYHFARIVLPELLLGSPIEPQAVNPNGTDGSGGDAESTRGDGEQTGSENDAGSDGDATGDDHPEGKRTDDEGDGGLASEGGD